MKLTSSSETKLRGVHPDLIRVVRRCAEDWADKETGFIVTCGVRTLAEQKVLKAKGASKTLRSRHIPAKNGFSHAVDLAYTIGGKVKWDWSLYIKLAIAIRAAAIKENVVVEWGGTWGALNIIKGKITPDLLDKKFPDGPHFQLPWLSYPEK